MAKIIGSPSRYVQGKGELKNLCTYSSAFAKKLFLLTSASGRGRVEGAIESGKGEVEKIEEDIENVDLFRSFYEGKTVSSAS